jgi:hypothetical protein
MVGRAGAAGTAAIMSNEKVEIGVVVVRDGRVIGRDDVRDDVDGKVDNSLDGLGNGLDEDSGEL